MWPIEIYLSPWNQRYSMARLRQALRKERKKSEIAIVVMKLMPMTFWRQKRGQHMSETVRKIQLGILTQKGRDSCEGRDPWRTLRVDLLRTAEIDRSWIARKADTGWNRRVHRLSPDITSKALLTLLTLRGSIYNGEAENRERYESNDVRGINRWRSVFGTVYMTRYTRNQT